MDDLERLREQIGALDRTVLEALNRRLELVRRVTRHKQETGAPLIDAEREADRSAELDRGRTPGPSLTRAVQAVFAAVLDVMKQETRDAAPVFRDLRRGRPRPPSAHSRSSERACSEHPSPSRRSGRAWPG